MDQDFDDVESSPPLFLLPISTPPPRLSPSRTLPPQFTQAGRPKRSYRLPARYEDVNPEPLPLLNEEDEQPTATIPRLRLIVRNRLRTATNSFGLLREYLYRPSFNPDNFVPDKDLHQVGGAVPVPMPPPSPTLVHRNQSVEMVMNWKDSGAPTKSDAEVNRLVKDVLLDPEFKLEDLRGFSVARENQQSDAAEKKSPFFDSFQTADINIEVPSGVKGVPPGIFAVPGLLYRKLTAIIQAAFSSPLASHFHLSPFKLYHKSPSEPAGEEERVFSELYNSDTFIEEHDKVQRAPIPPNESHCKREKVVAALMFWSDSTHLANFGTAKLWPIYLLFGNVSKYIRGRPNSGACQHVAYIPSLPDSFQDFATSFCSKWGTQKADLMTHCRRELMHGVWRFLLDDDFIHAYKYGMVVKCVDGNERRVYPRFFTYSADYPEK